MAQTVSMPFLHSQIDGSLWFRSEAANPWKRIDIGYSGAGDGLNNPGWQSVRNFGPIPAGKYKILPSSKKGLGPLVFDLLPDQANEMFGRSAFLIHWDTPDHSLRASEGCIIHRDPFVFQKIQTQVSLGDDQLEVVSLPPLVDPPKPSVT